MIWDAPCSLSTSDRHHIHVQEYFAQSSLELYSFMGISVHLREAMNVGEKLKIFSTGVVQ